MQNSDRKNRKSQRSSQYRADGDTNVAQSHESRSNANSIHLDETSQEQDRHSTRIEDLKYRLQKASWVLEDDKAAEVRYEHFLMLQSLSKSLTKFYQQEFGKNVK